MSLSIDDELNAVVKAPFFVSDGQIDEFVSKNQAWIEKAVLKKQNQLERYDLTKEEINNLIDFANEYIPPKIEYYSKLMNVKPTGVKITSAKKRFGSCSSKNSICFSLYLMTYPKEAIDYVIVHELAHIKHHNHSKEFYEFIERFMPDYKQREKLLKS